MSGHHPGEGGLSREGVGEGDRRTGAWKEGPAPGRVLQRSWGARGGEARG